MNMSPSLIELATPLFRQTRLHKLNEAAQQKRSEETSSEKEQTLEKDILNKKQKRPNRVLITQHEVNRQNCLNI